MPASRLTRLFALLVAALLATGVLACSAGCLDFGHDQTVRVAPDNDQAAGRDAWSFQFTKIEQAAGGGLGLSLIGWVFAGVRAWRSGKDRDQLIRAIERAEKKPAYSPTKIFLRDWVKNPRINQRVAELIHPTGRP